MKTINNSTINQKKLSEHDKQLFKKLFTYLDADDKKNIAARFGVSVSYVNMILASKRRNKKIFAYAIGQAIKNRKAHLNQLQTLKSV